MTDHHLIAPGHKSSGAVFIVCPYIVKGLHRIIDPQARLEEAKGLAEAIQLDVKGTEFFKQHIIRSATYISKGHVHALQDLIKALDINLVFIDAAISPVQQRNLEKAWNCKVIDRTGLILEIFGARARTAEGRLQVELAALTYQRSRLVRSWTHLERQRGGLGAVGGPGETQLELDRRLIDERIGRIKKELEDVTRTRALHRKARKRVPFPIVALVGYTNAGKSTLFNRLTQAGVMAEQMLFATLDPTMRRVHLPSGRNIILSDTVGFISDLPTLLVAAFRATLEEVVEADLILHVRDISHPETAAQNQDVMAVLADLDLGKAYENHGIEVLNKCDLLDKEKLQHLKTEACLSTRPLQCVVSALSGEGSQDLLDKINTFLASKEETYALSLLVSEGKKIAWLYAHGEVLERHDDETHAHLTVKLSSHNKEKFDRFE
ncbi:MAG: GTPase HflX [Alphaproteobacteria bacterium]|nr:GTPase HflX [Alphaproteobacteria bacterium]MBP9776597.1 GTPase HflX [Alphaproteobacteria bacterium]